MAKSEITAGICGFNTTVKTSMNGKVCNIEIESKCEHIIKMAQEFKQADPYREVFFRSGMPVTYEIASKKLPHAACPVPCGIIKAIEVEAKLALPKDVIIKITKE